MPNEEIVHVKVRSLTVVFRDDVDPEDIALVLAPALLQRDEDEE